MPALKAPDINATFISTLPYEIACVVTLPNVPPAKPNDTAIAPPAIIAGIPPKEATANPAASPMPEITPLTNPPKNAEPKLSPSAAFAPAINPFTTPPPTIPAIIKRRDINSCPVGSTYITGLLLQ